MKGISLETSPLSAGTEAGITPDLDAGCAGTVLQDAGDRPLQAIAASTHAREGRAFIDAFVRPG